MTGKITLETRRILITEVIEGIGNDLIRGLILKKAVVIIFAKSADQIKDLESAYPSLIIILLDLEKCSETSRKVLSKLPYLDHIINFSGSAFDNVFSCLLKHYRPESADIRTTKADDVISKLVLAGSRSSVINFSETGSTNFSGSSASLAATQFTDALRTSFRKLFRGKSLTEDESRQTSEINYHHEPAKRSSTVPISTIQSSSKYNQSPPGDSTPTRKLSLRFLSRNSGYTVKSNDEKLKKSFTKLHTEFAKVWERKLKTLKSKESKRLNELTREIIKFKKLEKSSINENNASLNAATLSRSEILSPETANKIVESRERKAEKDASKLAEKKFVERKTKLQVITDTEMVAAIEKHYQKILKREISILEKRTTNQ